MKSISNRLVLRRLLKAPEPRAKPPRDRFTGVKFFELPFWGVTPGKVFRIVQAAGEDIRYIKVSRTHADRLQMGSRPWRRSGNKEPIEPSTTCLILTQDYKDWMRAKYETDKA